MRCIMRIASARRNRTDTFGMAQVAKREKEEAAAAAERKQEEEAEAKKVEQEAAAAKKKEEEVRSVLHKNLCAPSSHSRQCAEVRNGVGSIVTLHRDRAGVAFACASTLHPYVQAQ